MSEGYLRKVTMSKDLCMNHLDTAVSLIEEMRTLLNDPDPRHDAPLAVLELSHEVTDAIQHAVKVALEPYLVGEKTEPEEDRLVLRIGRAAGGQWSGRLIAGGEEAGSIDCCASAAEVERKARDSGIIPDRIEIAGDDDALWLDVADEARKGGFVGD
jgi:hypothetical protein